MITLLLAVLSISAFATTYTVTDGYFNSKTIGNEDTLLMTGGGGGSIWAEGNGILDIRNTSSPYVYGVSGISSITMNDNSQLYFSGGSLRLLGATDDATIVLSGGHIGEINVYYSSDNPGHLTVYCQPDWTYENYYLSGLWLDNTPFNIRLYSQGASSDVFSNVTVIPEPTTLAFLAFGGLWMRKRRL
jgi:hypothetical protein